MTNLVRAFFNFNVQGEANPRLGSLYRLLDFTRTKMMLRELNISVRLVDVTRKAPRLVSSGEIRRERVQLAGLVVIHPLRLLLHWLWSVRLVNLRSMLVNQASHGVQNTLGRQ